jgi:hypothetical protein
MEPHDLAVAPGGAGGRAFYNDLIAEVSSHGRRPFLRMLCIQRATRTAPPHGPGSPNQECRTDRSPADRPLNSSDGRGDMHHRTVEELMTPDVVRAPRDMPFKEIVRLLAQNHVTAVPVVDELDRPMGVVSQADLLRNASTQADPSGRIPLPHLEE